MTSRSASLLFTVPNTITEDEKKVIATLLGKLYVSPFSSEEKIRSLYDEISMAVEENIMADATSRNALYKIHVSLGKIVNHFTEQEKSGRRSISRSVSVSIAGSVAGDDRTAREDSVLTTEPIKEEDISEDDERSNDTVRQSGGRESESLVEELLTDDE